MKRWKSYWHILLALIFSTRHTVIAQTTQPTSACGGMYSYDISIHMYFNITASSN